MSYIAHYYHIVFRTYMSQPSIPEETKRILFTYIYKMICSKGWKLIRINGYLDHIHILISLPATVRVCDVAGLIKSRSSKTFKRHPKFPDFLGWAGRYASFTVSYYEVNTIKTYIISQEEHHASQSMRSEMEELFRQHGMEIGDFFDDIPDPDKDTEVAP